VFVHQTCEKSLAEEAHERLAVPAIEALEAAICTEATIGSENLSVWMPLQEISSRRDGDHNPRPGVGAELPTGVLGQCFGATLTQIE